jgi:hypothetical protein
MFIEAGSAEVAGGVGSGADAGTALALARTPAQALAPEMLWSR